MKNIVKTLKANGIDVKISEDIELNRQIVVSRDGLSLSVDIPDEWLALKERSHDEIIQIGISMLLLRESLNDLSASKTKFYEIFDTYERLYEVYACIKGGSDLWLMNNFFDNIGIDLSIEEVADIDGETSSYRLSLMNRRSGNTLYDIRNWRKFLMDESQLIECIVKNVWINHIVVRINDGDRELAKRFYSVFDTLSLQMAVLDRVNCSIDNK